MTDRLAGFVVTLEVPLRDDDAEAIIDAIKMIKGVVAVAPVVDDQLVTYIAVHRANLDWVRKLRDVMDEMLNGGRG